MESKLPQSDPWVKNNPQHPRLEMQAIQQFLVASSDTAKICATLQALTWRLQKAEDIKKTIEETFTSGDLLGCSEESEIKLLDYLLRSSVRQIRSFTFSLLNTLATFQDGKKYLVGKADLIEVIISSLTA